MKQAGMLSALTLALTMTAAQGRECRGVSFADRLEVNGTGLVLNGLGIQRATFLRIDVYVAALYAAAATGDPAALIHADTPQVLIVQFLRNVGVTDVRQQWTRDFTHVVPERPPALMQRVATLNSWLSDVRRGERLMFKRLPGQGIEVIVDGEIMGTIPGEDFARVFMSIWVGATPPSAPLRRGLLGGDCD